MQRLLDQLDSIKEIVDTVTPGEVKQEPERVRSKYELYAKSYDPVEEAKRIKTRLIDEIGRGKPVTGYLSAEYGYGKTATLVYLWYECDQKQISAVPPFKFKELDDLMVASYGWIKYCLSRRNPELIPHIDELYKKYNLKSLEAIAAQIAKENNISESKALNIAENNIAKYRSTASTDSILGFWWDSVPYLKQAGMPGLAVFIDESEGFLRSEEGAGVRIQQLTDLIMGLRSKPDIPVALVMTVVSSTVEPLLEEQAGAAIARMKEQGVYLPLANAYGNQFPTQLWQRLCADFLDNPSQSSQIVHPGTLESLGQLCDRKDLTSGPRAVVRVFKRMVRFSQDKSKPYTPLDLVEDYCINTIQLYGREEYRIEKAIDDLEKLEVIKKHSKGREVTKLLAIFPAGVSESVALDLGLLSALKELADHPDIIGQHIKRTEHNPDRFALISLAASGDAPTTKVIEILKNFTQRWRDVWNDAEKVAQAKDIFKTEILPLLLPPKQGSRSNWSWKNWKEDKQGIPYLLLEGAPSDYEQTFPKRSLIVSVGSVLTQLGKLNPPEQAHLDWRFTLVYTRKEIATRQKLWALAGTNQLQFELQMWRSFESGYPKDFGLLNNVMSPESCSACTLLNLSKYIQDWLERPGTQVAKRDRDELEQYRRDLHRNALQLLIPAITPENWSIEGLKEVTGAETRLIESIFNQHCQTLFEQYKSFYGKMTASSFKSYKLALDKVPLAVRRGHQPYKIRKEEFERLFDSSGSGLPSLISTLKQCSLIDKYSAGSRKEEDSQVEFTEHPLEAFIREQLNLEGRSKIVETGHGSQQIKELNYPELWSKVEKLGYLEDEFKEALEWSERRKYIRWDKSRPVHGIEEAVAELDPDVIEGQLREVQTQLSQLIQAFNETELNQVNTRLDEARTNLNGRRNDEVVLDQVQRILQSCQERIEGFRIAKRSALQENLKQLKIQLENFSGDLNISKVSQIIQGSSGLETCLNDYRKNLERLIHQLDKNCKNSANSIKSDASDVLVLHAQVNQIKHSLKEYEDTKKRLQPIGNGLEQWKTIVRQAGTLRETLASDFSKLQRYENFLDEVVRHFSSHLLESFREWQLLKAPLDQIEKEIQGERRTRREAFDLRLGKYEELLNRIMPTERHLRDKCRFDDEDVKGSYDTLNLVVHNKIDNWCDSRTHEWNEIERKLSFLSQGKGQNLTELLQSMESLQTELNSEKALIHSSLSDLENFEKRVDRLKELQERGIKNRSDVRRLEREKGELNNEEKKVLNQIADSAITISQLCQRLPNNEDLWKLLQALHKKGHIEITFQRTPDLD